MGSYGGSPPRTAGQRVLAIAGLALFLLLVFAWRRPEEWHSPYPWVEEGTVFLPGYLANGWASLFAPVSGYLVIPAKLIFLMAVSIDAWHYPVIAHALTLAFEIGTLCLIAVSPTWLRYPWLAAVLVALMPTMPEVFAVSEYAFWWGALWSFVALFWREGSHPRTAWRCVLALVGGVSSPMAIPAAGLLLVRAALVRRRADIAVAIVATALAALQGVLMASNPSTLGVGDRQFAPVETVIRFFGHYVVSTPLAPHWLLFGAGLAMIAWLGFYAWRTHAWRDPWFMLLAAALVLSIAASLARVAVGLIHPVGAARYFFFPYLFLAWLLLYTYGEAGWPGRAFVACVVLLATSQCALHGRQVHVTFDWHAELGQCISSGGATYALPVQFNGDPALAWHVPLTGTQCRTLVDRSLRR